MTTEQSQIRLDGRVALVTGAGRGIGRAVALNLAKRGAAVLVNDLGTGLGGDGSDASVADEVAAEIVKAGGDAISSGESVTSPEGMERTALAAVNAFGKIDILVHSAGIIRNRIAHKMSLPDFDGVVQTHLYGAFNTLHAVLPVMRANGYGRIVNMTSASALIGAVGQSNYMAAKLGIVGLTRGIALDMARYGIQANCLSPAAPTRMVQALPEEVRSEGRAAADETTAERVTGHVADLVSWLAWEDNPLSGQVVGIRGREVYLYRQHRPAWSFVAGGDQELISVGAQAARHATPLEQVTDFFPDDPIV